ncbi:hypothetical protein MO867_12480 [Microbulbifer sp. OS29]|uniref:Uncharacterized protein n=1 Tax=Microbulbifer okhotskensis TaxID=2926617 RepID=A0A9X2ET88_9GAMM|nr:hypothetical protein [Microbulbifer okhotskensis]MCO1335148.1 hypothetical protein [Microbulbifer okhotskensis]
MKKLLATVSLCIAATGFPALASADTWSPNGSSALFNVGNITVMKGIQLSCNLSGSIDIVSSDASVGSLSLSGGLFGLCGTISFSSLPYNVVGNADDTITLEDVVVQAVTGSCVGDLVGDFDHSTGRITFNGANIPSSPAGGSPCVIYGVVDSNPQVSFVP